MEVGSRLDSSNWSSTAIFLRRMPRSRLYSSSRLSKCFKTKEARSSPSTSLTGTLLVSLASISAFLWKLPVVMIHGCSSRFTAPRSSWTTLLPIAPVFLFTWTRTVISAKPSASKMPTTSIPLSLVYWVVSALKPNGKCPYQHRRSVDWQKDFYSKRDMTTKLSYGMGAIMTLFSLDKYLSLIHIWRCRRRG